MISRFLFAICSWCELLFQGGNSMNGVQVWQMLRRINKGHAATAGYHTLGCGLLVEFPAGQGSLFTHTQMVDGRAHWSVGPSGGPHRDGARCLWRDNTCKSQKKETPGTLRTQVRNGGFSRIIKGSSVCCLFVFPPLELISLLKEFD